MGAGLNPAGWVRLAIYVLSALVGVAAVVTTTLGYGDLAALLGTIAGAGAAVTGGTAVVNLPKAPDQSRTGGFEIGELAPALQEIAAAARTYRGAVDYEPRHAVEEVDPIAPSEDSLPVYERPATGHA